MPKRARKTKPEFTPVRYANPDTEIKELMEERERLLKAKAEVENTLKLVNTAIVEWGKEKKYRILENEQHKLRELHQNDRRLLPGLLGLVQQYHLLFPDTDNPEASRNYIHMLRRNTDCIDITYGHNGKDKITARVRADGWYTSSVPGRQCDLIKHDPRTWHISNTQ